MSRFLYTKSSSGHVDADPPQAFISLSVDTQQLPPLEGARLVGLRLLQDDAPPVALDLGFNGFRILFNTRKYSTLQGVAPLEARERYPKLIDIGVEGDFALKPPFEQAVEQAGQNAKDARAKAKSDANATTPKPNGHGRMR